MATPPFDILQAKPADTDIVSQFPADERSNRDIIESAIGIEHGIGASGVEQGGRHRFGVGNTAARDAITTWEVGSFWLNTITTPVTLQRVVSINPDVWEDVTGAAFAKLADANIFTGNPQAIDATPQPTLRLRDTKASAGAANDELGQIDFEGKNSANANVSYGFIDFLIGDPAAGAQLGIGRLVAWVAGAAQTILTFSNGVQIGVPTGGPPGLGGLNAQALKVNNVDVSTATAATQAELEAASSTTTFATPGRQQFHPSGAKAWVHVTGGATPSLSAAYNILSITDRGVGQFTVNFIVPFSTASYVGIVTPEQDQGVSVIFAGKDQNVAQTAGAFPVAFVNSGGAFVDVANWYAAFFGDQ